jgi:hypothetical protein
MACFPSLRSPHYYFFVAIIFSFALGVILAPLFLFIVFCIGVSDTRLRPPLRFPAPGLDLARNRITTMAPQNAYRACFNAMGIFTNWVDANAGHDRDSGSDLTAVLVFLHMSKIKIRL